MIKFNPSKRVVRETTAPFEYTDDANEVQTDTIRVRYYAQTVKEARDRYERLKNLAEKDPSAVSWDSEELKDIVESLPDLVDAKEKPYKITLEFLESLSTKNLKAIKAAIVEDASPKSEPGK